ncbi:hypothetical protein QAD02_010723, partial [Eretmocerus hayati]
MHQLNSSWLYAIQEITGETREDKFKNIGRIVDAILKDIQDDTEILSAAKLYDVPVALVPFVRTLVGVKMKSFTVITEALKSDNSSLIVEALRARWFYNGSNRDVTNFKNFSTELFPYVSMSTRREIVKRLSVCLAEKTDLAEEFFEGLVTNYGVQEATTILPACRSDFIQDAIIKHKIILSCKLLKILFRKYPEIGVRYLKFANPDGRTDEISRTMFRMIDIYEYESFMPLIMLKYPDLFVSMQEIYPTMPTVGNKRAKLFLKNAKHVLIKKPKGTIELLPIKMVCDMLTQAEFETMIGNILEDHWDMFKLDYMLNYLEYYPEEKRASLIRSKVKEKYGYDLHEKVEKVTPRYLLLVSKEDRHLLARRIVDNRHKIEYPDTETSWWCYLPVDEAIQALKLQISKNWRSNKRQNYFSQLIYVCKLNENKEALIGVLKYVDEKYKNERSDVIISMLDRIAQEFDLDGFDLEFWTVVLNIIKRVKLKKENARDYWVLIKILKKNVHYCNDHDIPTEDIIDLIIKLFFEGRVGVSWKLLEDDPTYERKYLDVCFRNNYWSVMDYKKNVIEGIYSFNERYASDQSVPKFSIKDYPHLLEVVGKTLREDHSEESTWIIYTKHKLKIHEPDLYESWFPNDEQIPSCDYSDGLLIEEEAKSPAESNEKIIYMTEAIIALKRNYGEIKRSWERYYECCKNEIGSKKRRRVRQFLKALRWYHDIPIKFAERAIEELNFDILAYLVDGHTFCKIALFLLPTESDEDRNYSYLNALKITAVIRNTSTPISILVVQRYLLATHMYSYKNYINDGLKLWSYVSYRTSSDQMITLARNLSKERLFLRRHAIRLMNAMASSDDLVTFYSELWKSEDHLLIRKMLAEKVSKLFTKRPSQATWELMSLCLSSLLANDDQVLEDLMGSKAIPPQFSSEFAEKILKVLDVFVSEGMSKHEVARILDKLFENLKPDCTDQLSDDLHAKLIDKYLSNIEFESKNADRFVVKVYLNPTSLSLNNRLKHLSLVLMKESKRWHSLSMENRRNVSNFVDNFVQIVVYQVQKFKGNLVLTESLFEIFSRIFTPYQHAWSHIMLFLCTEYLKSGSCFKQFGLVLSEKIIILVERYTPEYFIQITEYIRDFICNFSFYEYAETVKQRLKLLEGLIENKSFYGLMIAAKLLNKKIVSEYDPQHCKILQELSDVNNEI